MINGKTIALTRWINYCQHHLNKFILILRKQVNPEGLEKPLNLEVFHLLFEVQFKGSLKKFIENTWLLLSKKSEFEVLCVIPIGLRFLTEGNHCAMF